MVAGVLRLRAAGVPLTISSDAGIGPHRPHDVLPRTPGQTTMVGCTGAEALRMATEPTPIRCVRWWPCSAPATGSAKKRRLHLRHYTLPTKPPAVATIHALTWLGCWRRLQVRWDRDSGRLFAVTLVASALVCLTSSNQPTGATYVVGRKHDP